MALYWVQSTDPGAPSLTGQNGSGNLVFDYILNTIAGLTIQYTGTNRSVVQMPDGSVLRYYHDSAASGNARFMIVRAAESASAIDTLVDEFPLTSQVADSLCNVLVSFSANATVRPWWALVDTSTTTSCFHFFNEPETNNIAGGMFWGGGTQVSSLPVDAYATVLYTRASAVTTTATGAATKGVSGFAGTPVNHWLRRSRDGIVKSCTARAGPYTGGTLLGITPNGPTYPDPDDGKLRLCKVNILDYYSQSSTPGISPEWVRMWVPRLFQPMHEVSSWASIDNGDTFAASSYDPSAQFAFFKFGNVSGDGGTLAVQIAGAWAVPSG